MESRRKRGLIAAPVSAVFRHASPYYTCRFLLWQDHFPACAIQEARLLCPFSHSVFFCGQNVKFTRALSRCIIDAHLSQSGNRRKAIATARKDEKSAKAWTVLPRRFPFSRNNAPCPSNRCGGSKSIIGRVIKSKQPFDGKSGKHPRNPAGFYLPPDSSLPS